MTILSHVTGDAFGKGMLIHNAIQIGLLRNQWAQDDARAAHLDGINQLAARLQASRRTEAAALAHVSEMQAQVVQLVERTEDLEVALGESEAEAAELRAAFDRLYAIHVAAVGA